MVKVRIRKAKGLTTTQMQRGVAWKELELKRSAMHDSSWKSEKPLGETRRLRWKKAYAGS
jgi:hypothetical protein